MLPHVADKQWKDPPDGQILMFFRLKHHKVAHVRFIGQNAPSACFNRVGGGDELIPETIEAPEAFVDRLQELTLGLTGFGGHVGPVKGMEYVAGAVKGEFSGPVFD